MTITFKFVAKFGFLFIILQHHLLNTLQIFTLPIDENTKLSDYEDTLDDYEDSKGKSGLYRNESSLSPAKEHKSDYPQISAYKSPRKLNL